jgi:UDP-glucose 4-epimerase
MRVFITGTGVVGCHVAHELAARGDDVTLFDLSPRTDYVARVAGAGVSVVRGDVRELPGLLEAVEQARPEIVIHTAALVGGQAGVLPYRGYMVNVVGTINVAEAARLLGVRRLLHASTLGVIDRSAPQTAPIPETHYLGGNDRVYGTSKVACEQILRTYAGTYKFELALLRFASVYGYGYPGTGSGPTVAIHELLAAALDGRPGVLGSGMPDVDELVYVRDLVAGILRAIDAPKLPHHTYNLGGGRLTTADEILSATRQVVPGADVTRPAGDGTGGGRARIEQPMDLGRSREELGYEPRFDLEAGLRDLAASIKGGSPAATGGTR